MFQYLPMSRMKGSCQALQYQPQKTVARGGGRVAPLRASCRRGAVRVGQPVRVRPVLGHGGHQGAELCWAALRHCPGPVGGRHPPTPDGRLLKTVASRTQHCSHL